MKILSLIGIFILFCLVATGTVLIANMAGTEFILTGEHPVGLVIAAIAGMVLSLGLTWLAYYVDVKMDKELAYDTTYAKTGNSKDCRDFSADYKKYQQYL